MITSVSEQQLRSPLSTVLCSIRFNFLCK